MPPQIGRRYLKLLSDSRMVTISGAGHSPHLERPDEFAALLQGFVEKHVPVVERASRKNAPAQRE
jgi:pimeloyl-ACP methyl ester carboxylesterase